MINYPKNNWVSDILLEWSNACEINCSHKEQLTIVVHKQYNNTNNNNNVYSDLLQWVLQYSLQWEMVKSLVLLYITKIYGNSYEACREINSLGILEFEL